MGKKAKMSIYDVAAVLKKHGMTAESFNNGIHWRIKPINIDLWPTTGRWKSMTERFSGTVEDLDKFLSGYAERMSLLDEVVTRRS